MKLDFSPSERSTIGIEWELQLIDSDSSNLRQSAEYVLQAANDANPGQKLLHKEMLLNTVEIVSRPRRRVSQCLDDLTEGLQMVQPITDELRIDLATAGSHPFANPIYQLVTDSERYAELVERTQYWGRQMLLFGTHVHVGIERREQLLPVLHFLLTKLAHMQSLTAASPFWAGMDTGYCDNRAMVFQQLPTAGTPRDFDTWDQLEDYTEDLHRTGIIRSFDEIRWDIRPSPKLGTIEIRVADASTNLMEVGAFAALVHCLVEDAVRKLDNGEPLERMQPWYVDENKWRSARYGMDATIIENSVGEERPIRESINELLDSLVSVSVDLGCAEELANWQEIIRGGVGYQRQRKIQERYGNLEAVVELMRAERKAGHPLDPGIFEFSGNGEHTPIPGGHDRASENTSPSC